MVWLYICVALFVSNVVGLYCWVQEIASPLDTPIDWFLPHRLHQLTDMNWFGCWFCSFFLLIFCTIAYVIQFCYWLMHL